MSRLAVKQPREYTKEEIDQMVEALRTGDTTMIVPIIEAHYYLSEKMTKYFSISSPHRRDDIRCVGFYALADAVNKAATILTDNNITAYLARSIKCRIREYIYEDSLIPIPRELFKSMQERESVTDFVERTTPVTMNNKAVYGFDIHESGVIENAPIFIPLTDSTEIPYKDKRFQTMEDLLQSVRLSPIETDIAMYRLDGLTLEEIGEKLGVTKMAVSYRIDEIKNKLSRLGFKNLCYHRLSPAKQTCSRCQREQSVDFFYKIGEGKYKSICKQCMKEKHEQTANIH